MKTSVLQEQMLSPARITSNRQKEASNPEHDIWVAASAGSGKTTVLTNRVLRLLLPDTEEKWQGSPPHKILCITFTKAAAALMALRIQKRLGQWAIMSDKELFEDLESLTGKKPTQNMLSAARQLFTKVLDVPGGMSIMTIHAFCQSTLARFPLEAGLTPGFKVLEEQRSKELLSQSILSLVTDIESKKRPDLEALFSRIALGTDFESLKSILLSTADQFDKIHTFIEQYGRGASLKKILLKKLGFTEDLTKELILKDFVSRRPEDSLKEAAKVLGATSSSINQKTAGDMAMWLSMDPDQRIKNISLYQEALLTKDKTPRKIYGKIEHTRPDVFSLINKESELLLEIIDHVSAIDQAQQTADFLTFTTEIFSSYTLRKRHLNALDFNDLIIKTRKLLEQKGEEWVHFKLDEGIDHILVDEAQDTNINQWKIIEHLSKELHSGQGRETKSPRSLFVVGDKKQSIFSFQGADPSAFTQMKHFFENRSKEAKREFNSINLETSFRTTKPILDLVDLVFREKETFTKLGLETDESLIHYSGRKDSAGKIELWDLIKKEEAAENTGDSGWDLPFSQKNNIGTLTEGKNLDLLIAGKIKQMIETREIVPTTGRPAEPRDFLVLVRTRTGPLIAGLIRQLKKYNIPVSGVDRMTLRNQISVEDCLALAKFSRLPEDDLSLACVLKSPFIRITEDEVMSLAIDRSRKESLWSRVKNSPKPEIKIWLELCIHEAQHLMPFDFFNKLLSCPCPNDPEGSGLRAFTKALGPDCIDPLDEFLNYCLNIEKDGICGMEDFVSHMEKTDFEIKRDLEDSEKESANQVQIMTVHASKGLEAPIVFLPDTASLPGAPKTPKLFWIEDGSDTTFPLWTESTSHICRVYKDILKKEKEKTYEEYLRLLYVAMTRARDHLYIAGEQKRKTSSEANLTWYQLIEKGFNALKNTKSESGKRTYETKGALIKAPVESGHTPHLHVPEWLHHPPPRETQPRHFVRPSSLAEKGETVLSPLEISDNNRFERGILTHRLFEFLPNIPDSTRRQSAQIFLKKAGKHLSEHIREDIVNEVMEVIENPVFAPVFGPNSLAEVPVTGDIGQGRILSGQIDRLVIEKNRILIIDFKSNRPSPTKESDIPSSYRDQLKAYKSAISKIYPNKEIECALLWTDRATLMPISV